MEKQNKLVDFSSILEMVGGEDKFLKEFAEAAIISFEEFSVNYSKYLLERNETEFRKAGHKIKPVVMMLNIDLIIDEYEYQKTQFGLPITTEELESSSKKMTDICDRVLKELKDITSEK